MASNINCFGPTVYILVVYVLAHHPAGSKAFFGKMILAVMEGLSVLKIAVFGAKKSDLRKCDL